MGTKLKLHSKKVLKLRISAELLNEIDRITVKGKRSLFVKKAIANYILITAPDYDKINQQAIKSI